MIKKKTNNNPPFIKRPLNHPPLLRDPYTIPPKFKKTKKRNRNKN